MTVRRRLAALLALTVALSGCSPAGAESPSAGSTATAPTADDCGDAAATVQKHLNSSDVTTVTVNGQCTNVTIDTGLTDADTARGRKLCESAAEVAYVGDVNSVTVRSKSKAELSIGIPGAACLSAAGDGAGAPAGDAPQAGDEPASTPSPSHQPTPAATKKRTLPPGSVVTVQPIVPTIEYFRVKRKPECRSVKDGVVHEGAPAILEWQVTGTGKVQLSVDGPGLYAEYGPSGSDSLPFPCDVAPGATQSHSFTLTAIGLGRNRSRTLVVKAQAG
ncbi:hypothetical protein [Actinoplanes sp. L3-i22]|uniref:hypothetical protein n=1 Tax=Actinoplanes sp. L3-i22 TaxID=2836373 RepID=UPI001C77D8FE|nr:hypothetical protein [Actinoplanes sp. L3-i22]BCY12134.1 hypothetical protein L3i22_072220 [Actinoplanes sp. L3-i22]